MAAAEKSGGVVVQSWVSPDLASALKKQADAERRSVSATICLAVEDRLRESAPRRRR